MDRYRITCQNKNGAPLEELISAVDDQNAIRKYNHVRKDNPDFWDWRLWKLNLPWKSVLIAANEG